MSITISGSFPPSGPDQDAAMCDVVVCRPDGKGKTFRVKALVDPGADQTVMSTRLVELAALEAGDHILMGGVSEQEGQVVPRYHARLIFGENPHVGTDLLCASHDGATRHQCIIGTDLLRNVRFVYDGPARRWEMTFTFKSS